MTRGIPLAQGYTVIVDDEDHSLVRQYAWWAHKDQKKTDLVYVHGWIPNPDNPSKGRTVCLHRFLLGVLDKPAVKVDHKNGNGLDNRRANLRLTNAAGNSRNRRYTSNKSGYKGVVMHSVGCYEARIRVNGHRLYLGCYKTAREAAQVYDNAARKHHGEFACPNFSTSNGG